MIEQKTSHSGAHLFFKLQNNNKTLKAVFFNFADGTSTAKIEDLKDKNIDILFHLNKKDSGDLQLVIKDIKIHK